MGKKMMPKNTLFQFFSSAGGGLVVFSKSHEEVLNIFVCSSFFLLGIH